MNHMVIRPHHSGHATANRTRTGQHTCKEQRPMPGSIELTKPRLLAKVVLTIQASCSQTNSSSILCLAAGKKNNLKPQLQTTPKLWEPDVAATPLLPTTQSAADYTIYAIYTLPCPSGTNPSLPHQTNPTAGQIQSLADAARDIFQS